MIAKRWRLGRAGLALSSSFACLVLTACGGTPGHYSAASVERDVYDVAEQEDYDQQADYDGDGLVEDQEIYDGDGAVEDQEVYDGDGGVEEHDASGAMEPRKRKPRKICEPVTEEEYPWLPRTYVWTDDLQGSGIIGANERYELRVEIKSIDRAGRNADKYDITFAVELAAPPDLSATVQALYGLDPYGGMAAISEDIDVHGGESRTLRVRLPDTDDDIEMNLYNQYSLDYSSESFYIDPFVTWQTRTGAPEPVCRTVPDERPRKNTSGSDPYPDASYPDDPYPDDPYPAPDDYPDDPGCEGDYTDMDDDGRTYDDYDADGDGKYESY